MGTRGMELTYAVITLPGTKAEMLPQLVATRD